MSSRTVLVLPAWYPTAQHPYAGPYVRDHARAAAAFGHQMVVVVDEGPSGSVQGLYSIAEEREGSLRVFRLSYRPKTGTVSYLSGVLAIARRLRAEGSPVDLLHAHVHRMGWAAVLAGAILRRPVVITEHSTEWPDRTITTGALRRARIAFRRAALVCPVSAHLQQAIEAYGVHARFRVVPNTVDTSIFHPASSRERREVGRLVNVGLHVPRKGLDVLLRAVAKIVDRRPELTLDLVGEGSQSADLEELANRLGLADRVTFSGASPPEQVAESLRRADVFVLSSLTETGPIVVLEALCCGLPVVATRVGSAAEAVDDDGAIAPPGDVNGLADAIDKVVEGYDRFDQTSIAARAASRCSFEAVGGIWDEIYRSL